MFWHDEDFIWKYKSYLENEPEYKETTDYGIIYGTPGLAGVSPRII
jgi:hypothetical protein